ncbi:hypothetical protein D3C86_1951620 [compost metagenome]
MDLCFLPQDEERQELDAALIASFLEGYYSALPNKPEAWLEMVQNLKKRETVELKPL